MKKTGILILSLFVILFLVLPVSSQQMGRILVILDCSTEMRREIGSERMIYVAQKEVIKFVENLKADSSVGVMVFGHSTKRCDDAEMIVPFGKPDSEDVLTALAKINPIGDRGLIRAMVEGVETASAQDEDFVIYLITSGTDQCGDRDYLIEEAFEQYGKRGRLVVIGVDVGSRDADRLKEMTANVRGTYHSISHPNQLNSILANLAQSTQGNLNVMIRGSDPDITSATIRIFDESVNLIETASIEGFYSTNLPTGIYDIELTYRGKNYWQRQVFISANDKKQVTFDLDQAVGELSLEILDANDERIKGNLTLFDEYNDVVFEGKNQSVFLVSLPEGFYSAEVKVGTETEYYDFIEIVEEGLTDFIATVATMAGTVEIVVNNYDGIPVNASVLVEDMEGTVVGESEFTSTYRIVLPPGDYTAVVTASNGIQQEEMFYITEGDNITVDIEMDVPLGSVIVFLLTPEGNEVYGRIKVYDERGREVPHFEWEAVEDAQFTFDLPIGTYRITADVEGVIRTVDGIQVNAEDETEVRITFPEDLG